LNILSHTMSGHVRMAHVAGFSPSLSEEWTRIKPQVWNFLLCFSF
jgi:hypothetical protein